MKNLVMYKTFTYWPDGSWKEAPNDGYVFTSYTDTYQWDGHLEVWVTGYGGNIIDFTPPGMPGKMYDLDDMPPVEITSAKSVPECDCGAHKTSNPNRHAHWCKISEAI
jgi:hypothetical protein